MWGSYLSQCPVAKGPFYREKIPPAIFTLKFGGVESRKSDQKVGRREVRGNPITLPSFLSMVDIPSIIKATFKPQERSAAAFPLFGIKFIRAWIR